MNSMTANGARALMALSLLVLAGAGCTERNQAVAEPTHAEHGDEAHADHDAHEHAGEAPPGHASDEAHVTLSRERRRAHGVVVAPLAPRPVQETLRAAAEIGFNENRRVVVTARSGGWAEKIAVFANERVRANQLLAEIYSPEFLSAQQEYLLILDRAARGGVAADDSRSLLNDAEQRLRLLGLTDDEVQALARLRKPYPFLHVHSPIPGTVVEHKLNTGDTVQPGQPLYVVADLSRVWARISLTEMQLSRVRPGQPVTLTVKAYPGERFRGTVLSLGAGMDHATRTVKARAAITNAGERLKPGMFADAEIEVGNGAPALALPEEAVLRGADGDWVVYVEEAPDRFTPVEVEVLRHAGGHLVIDGVMPGTRVVTKGAFFVHSELAKGGFEVHAH